MPAKSQTSFEFIMLIAGLLALFLPLFYILGDYGISATSDIRTVQIKETSQKIVDEAREIFYLGRFSKEVVSVNMPERIAGMESYMINGSTTEYYFIVTYLKEDEYNNLTIVSEVPIVTNSSCSSEPCFAGDTCYTCVFSEELYAGGAKDIRLETIPWKGELAVNITQVNFW